MSQPSASSLASPASLWAISMSAPDFSFLDVAYMKAELACDAVIGNMQESMFKVYGADSNEMLIYSNIYSAVLSFIFDQRD
jgi:hypothetical protein